MDAQSHWDRVYRTNDATLVSWHQDRPVLSLDFIRLVASDTATPVIDVGGGASMLVDELLATGYRNLTVL